MNKRFRIFISSTFDDLKEERLTIQKCILERGHLPVGMELFPSLNTGSWEYIKRILDNDCDYLILIVGWNYGTDFPKSRSSYTMKEYNYAIKKKIPIICVLAQDIPKYKTKEILSDSDKLKKQTNFRDKIMAKRNVTWFSDVTSLRKNVDIGLTTLFRNERRKGLIPSPHDLFDQFDFSPSIFLKGAYYSFNSNEIQVFDIAIDLKKERNVINFIKGYVVKINNFHIKTNDKGNLDYFGTIYIQNNLIYIDTESQDASNSKDRINIVGQFGSKSINSLSSKNLVIFAALQATSSDNAIQSIEVILIPKGTIGVGEKNKYERFIHRYLWMHRNNFWIPTNRVLSLGSGFERRIKAKEHHITLLKDLPGKYRIWTCQKVLDNDSTSFNISQSIMKISADLEASIEIAGPRNKTYKNVAIIRISRIANETARICFSIHQESGVNLLGNSICEIPSLNDGDIYTSGYCDYGIIQNRKTGKREVIAGYFVATRDFSDYEAEIIKYREISNYITNNNSDKRHLLERMYAKFLEVNDLEDQSVNL